LSGRGFWSGLIDGLLCGGSQRLEFRNDNFSDRIAGHFAGLIAMTPPKAIPRPLGNFDEFPTFFNGQDRSDHSREEFNDHGSDGNGYRNEGTFGPL
jgi:hypothetical protein